MNWPLKTPSRPSKICLNQNLSFSLSVPNKCHQLIEQHLFVSFRTLRLMFCFFQKRYQARIQGRWNRWIFNPLFSESLSFFLFSYPSNIDWFYDIITKIYPPPPFQNPGSAPGYYNWYRTFITDLKHYSQQSKQRYAPRLTRETVFFFYQLCLNKTWSVFFLLA